MPRDPRDIDASGSWLCPTAADRARLLDMESRLAPVRRQTMAVLALALVAGGPWIGWWTVALLAGALGAFAAATRLQRTSSRPEWAVAFAWGFAQLAIAGSIAITGGPASPAVAWLAIPAVTLPARFTRRGVIAGSIYTAVLMLAATVGVDPAAAAAFPPDVIAPLAVLVAVVTLSLALQEAEVEHRNAAVIDPLTGMLNRAALERRVAELGAQSRVTRQPVGVVALDIDHFKAINDRFGHQHGDAVLKEVAYRIRRELRAYDLAYRLGGEEFVVLLPGAAEVETAAIAERVRAAIAKEHVAGVPLTISAGFAHSEGVFEFDHVYACADAALYDAKRRGRDRVCGQRRPRTAPVTVEVG